MAKYRWLSFRLGCCVLAPVTAEKVAEPHTTGRYVKYRWLKDTPDMLNEEDCQIQVA